MKKIVQMFVVLATLAPFIAVMPAFAQGTAFTYQGRLQSNGSPASGTYNFTFTLFNVNTGGTNVAGPVSTNGVIVTNGLFAVALDFGSSVWNGQTNWLEIAVETNLASPFTTLAPRQQLMPVPYAIYAENAGIVSASQLTSIGNNNVGAFGNFFIGGAGNATMSGAENIADGLFSLTNNTSGSANTADGAVALFSNTIGSDNTASGNGALYYNTIGSYNTADGYDALLNNRIGSFNTADGYQALLNNTSGSNNIALGNQAGEFITTGGGNIDIGNEGLSTDTNIIRIGTPGIQTGTYIAGVINGNGGGLTNLNALQIAGGLLGLTIQQNTNGAPNLIGGSSVNFVSGGIVGATIGGGGATNYGGIVFINSVTGNFGTVGGGANNTAALSATVGGGSYNTANNTDATVAGGANNTASGQDATVAGGYQNTANGELATVGGGYKNTASGELATVGGGGAFNTASGISSFVGGGGYDGSTFSANNALGNASVIGGGLGNTISSGGNYAFIGGGAFNTASGQNATVGGGSANTASGIGSFVGGGGFDGTTTNGNNAVGNASVIGGGWGNTNSAIYAVISGGYQNFIQPGVSAVIGGGAQNVVESNSFEATIAGGWTNVIGTNANQATIGGGLHNTASGYYATVPGGANNLAGGTLSFAAGSYAQATNSGSFVWSDNSSTSPFMSTNDNSFSARAAGGFQFYTSSSGHGGAGLYVAPGGNSWVSISDRNAKKNFQPVDTVAVLDKLAAIPIEQWNYKWENDSDVPNIGPMAQDFKRAFFPGRDDKGISTLEFDGVELAAIQGLNEKVESRTQKAESQMEKLEAENADLKARLEKLEQLVAEKDGGVK